QAELAHVVLPGVGPASGAGEGVRAHPEHAEPAQPGLVLVGAEGERAASGAGRFLTALKAQAWKLPWLPIRRPLYAAPAACAQSSTIVAPASPAASYSSSRSHGRPP